jgi:hypothetical protein
MNPSPVLTASSAGLGLCAAPVTDWGGLAPQLSRVGVDLAKQVVQIDGVDRGEGPLRCQLN